MRTIPWQLLAAGALVASLASCGGGGRDVFPEAEALEKEGKLAEAADRFELVCAYSPTSPHCGEADARAFEVRMKAADAEIGQGHFLAAERLLRRAVLTTDEAGRKRAMERIAQPDLSQGILCERAIAMADKKAAARALDPIAASTTPAAAKAKEWLAKEGPAILAQAVRDACGSDHEGSCTEAFAKLKESGAKGPAVDEAAHAAEAEQARVKPLRAQAESFLKVFATLGKKKKAVGQCVTDHTADGTDPSVVRAKCEEDAFGTDPDDKRYQVEKNNDNLFRRLLRQIGDPALTRDYEARKGSALAEGEVPAATTIGRSP